MRVGAFLILMAVAIFALTQATAAPETRKVPDGVIIFAEGSNEPLADSRAIIDQLAVLAKSDPANWVSLDSYTDESGSREMNLALGQQRIAGIEREMALQGVPPHRIRGISHDKDSSIKGEQPMRRVEVRIEKLGY